VSEETTTTHDKTCRSREIRGKGRRSEEMPQYNLKKMKVRAHNMFVDRSGGGGGNRFEERIRKYRYECMADGLRPKHENRLRRREGTG